MTTPKERPVPFSAPMVCALLDGSKTQTRRVIKPEGAHTVLPLIGADDKPTGEYGWCPNANVISDHIRCPYGTPGDTLWVREAFRTVDTANHLPPRDLDAAYRLWFEADAPHQPGYGKLRPSMFMPRWTSRINLEVTDVRVEHLQDISEADAIAEGIVPYQPYPGRFLSSHRPGLNFPSAVAAYQDLWESINGAGSWDLNPWVWAVSFRRLHGL